MVLPFSAEAYSRNWAEFNFRQVSREEPKCAGVLEVWSVGSTTTVCEVEVAAKRDIREQRVTLLNI